MYSLISSQSSLIQTTCSQLKGFIFPFFYI